MLAFLGNPACPVDFSRVTHVTIGILFHVEVYPFLHPFQQTIVCLEFIFPRLDPENLESLDFGSFPALSNITIRGFHSTLAALQHALQRSRRNTIRTICYYLYLSPDGDMAVLPGLEACILAADMPALRRVEVTAFRPVDYRRRSSKTFLLRQRMPKVFKSAAAPVTTPTARSDAEWRLHIEEKMPQLVERGILAITFGN